MASQEIKKLETTLDGQLEDEIVEIESDGTIKPSGQGINQQGKKVVLHDSKGEYGYLARATNTRRK